MTENAEFLLKETKDATTADALAIVQKTIAGERIDAKESAILIHRAVNLEASMLFGAARLVRKKVYGKRMVLFAPLYLSNYCINDCTYCGFKVSNKDLKRKILDVKEVEKEVRWLHRRGYRRVLLEAGEYDKYSPIDQVCEIMKFIYSLRDDHGRPIIDRINVNIAATNQENYRKLLNAGIGTYNLFQETYHIPTYDKMHPRGPKNNYIRQIIAPSEAIEAGIGDIGMGVLLGLYDWKYDLLSLIIHSLELEKICGIGPHAISFPRVKPAEGVNFTTPYPVSNDDYLRIIAITRLALPYAGQIISTRESPEIRRQAFLIGISQTSAGSSTEVGGYYNDHHSGQFTLADERPLDEVVRELLEMGFVPAFCTGCEQRGRTGTAFMRVAQSSEIGNFCSLNSILSLAEYIRDGAKFLSKETVSLGLKTIEREIKKAHSPFITKDTRESVKRIFGGENALKFYI